MFLRQLHVVLIRTTQKPQAVRSYSRWAHRRPSKIILPHSSGSKTLETHDVVDLTKELEETMKLKDIKPKKKHVQVQKIKSVQNLKDNFTENNTPNHNASNETNTHENCRNSGPNVSDVKLKRQIKIINTKQKLNQLKVFDENNQIIYEKCKDRDGRVSTLLVKLKSKKERQKTGMVLVEGWRLIVDGLQAKCKLKYVIFSNKQDLDNISVYLPSTGVKLYKIPYKEIKLWSDVETSPGIIGVFETPSADQIKRWKPFPIQLICDNIRVPGNLGAILRTATGVGCDKVLLSKGCVDLWDPKVLRSAAGAHFRIPIENNLEWEQLEEKVQPDSSVFIADSNIDIDDEESVDAMKIPVVPYYSIEYANSKHVTVIIGGETEGISEKSYRFALNRNGVRINIPLQKGVDSLNSGMAAAVITFEIKKQLLQAWTRAKLDKEGALSNG